MVRVIVYKSRFENRKKFKLYWKLSLRFDSIEITIL